MFVFIILSFLFNVQAASAETTGKLNGHLRIVGGTDAAALPTLAFSAGSKLCAATLIYPDVLLSAAHCVGIFIENGIYLGGNTVDGAGSLRLGVIEEFPHPEYDTVTDANDIMLIKLSQPVGTTPIQLNYDPQYPPDGVDAKVIGYGKTSENGSSSFTLQEASIPIVPYLQCDSFWNKLDASTQICTGLPDGSRDSCQGDSGGPLLVNNIQVGIVSFGLGCARPDTPSVYARISGYQEFIESGLCNISSNPPSTCPMSTPLSVPVVVPSKQPVSTPTTTPISLVTSVPVAVPINAPFMTDVPLDSPVILPITAPMTMPTGAPTDASNIIQTITPTKVSTVSPSRPPVVSSTFVPVDTVPTAVPANIPTIDQTNSPTKVTTESPIRSPVVSSTFVPIDTTPITAPVEIPIINKTNAPTMVAMVAPTTTPVVLSAFPPVDGKSPNPIAISTNLPVASPIVSPKAVATTVPAAPVNKPVNQSLQPPTSSPIFTPVSTQTESPVDAASRSSSPMSLPMTPTISPQIVTPNASPAVVPVTTPRMTPVVASSPIVPIGKTGITPGISPVIAPMVNPVTAPTSFAGSPVSTPVLDPVLLSPTTGIQNPVTNAAPSVYQKKTMTMKKGMGNGNNNNNFPVVSPSEINTPGMKIQKAQMQMKLMGGQNQGNGNADIFATLELNATISTGGMSSAVKGKQGPGSSMNGAMMMGAIDSKSSNAPKAMRMFRIVRNSTTPSKVLHSILHALQNSNVTAYQADKNTSSTNTEENDSAIGALLERFRKNRNGGLHFGSNTTFHSINSPSVNSSNNTNDDPDGEFPRLSKLWDILTQGLASKNDTNDTATMVGSMIWKRFFGKL